MYANYSRVRLLTDRFLDEGLKPGDIGYIIEVYADDSYEVEFSDSHGITSALIVAQASDLEIQET